MVLAAFQYDRHRTVSEKSWEVYLLFSQPARVHRLSE